MLFVSIFDVKRRLCGRKETYNIYSEFVRYDPGILLEEMSACRQRFKIPYAYEYLLPRFESVITVI